MSIIGQMDCASFDSSLLDALYDELDESTSTAMDEHAAGCESCRSKLGRLRQTREAAIPALETPLPEGLEARIMAATADAAMAKSNSQAAGQAGQAGQDVLLRDGAASNVVTLAAGSKKRTGVVAFLSRPQFAIAATFVLVLGAAALLVNTSKKSASSESMSAAASPGAPAAAAADDLSTSSPAATTIATTTAPVVAASGWGAAGAVDTPTMPGGQLAYRDPSPPPSPSPPADLDRADNEQQQRNKPKSENGAAEAKLADGLRGENSAPSKSAQGPSNVTRGGGGGGGSSSNNADPAFVSAKALYDAGRYNEALPKFEALSASSPEAELYVARCLAVTKGCDAAAARYDSVARRSAGTYNASTASLEAARCYGRNNQATAARSRYKALTNDNFVSNEATKELEAIESTKSGVKAAKPATPKAQATGGTQNNTERAQPTNAR